MDKKLFEEINKLNITLINRNAGISDLHPAECSEIFMRLDIAMTKAHKEVVELMEDNDHMYFDVIMEGQPIEEIVLYALSYRAMKKITDFTLNILLEKYNELRKKMQKLQQNFVIIYLADEAEESFYKLTKRRQILDVYDMNFVNAYSCIMTANCINSDDIVLCPSYLGQTKTQAFLLETISTFFQEEKLESRDSPQSPDPPCIKDENN